MLLYTVHFHVIHDINVKSEGISKYIPPYCSCVESSSSCTGTIVQLKNGNPNYWEIHRGEYYYLKSSHITKYLNSTTGKFIEGFFM